jgi:hypothetical protein
MLLGTGVLIGVVGTLALGTLLSSPPSVPTFGASPSAHQHPPVTTPTQPPSVVFGTEDRPVDENGKKAPLWSTEVQAAAALTALPGFSGEVHEAIHKTKALTLTSYWSKLPNDTLDMHENESRRGFFGTLQPVDATRSVDAEVFSAFLPAGDPPSDGVWAVDLERVGRLLTQFHPNPTFRLHNGGPNGGFALLRAESEGHWLINSRVHAEFHLGEFNYYTPAYFEIDLLINRQTRELEFFRLALPQRHRLNVDLNAGDDQVDIKLVKRMELSTGDRPNYQAMTWSTWRSEHEAWKSLSSAFYAFQRIDWLDIDEVATLAKLNQKPINIMMMWGVLDDQSC